jgi:site-specific DNA-methyltransferase (adenine-specific)
VVPTVSSRAAGHGHRTSPCRDLLAGHAIVDSGSQFRTGGWQTGQGRWPPNLLLDRAAAKFLDLQSGPRGHPGGPGRKTTYLGGYGGGVGTMQGPLYFDTGGASRFFPVFDDTTMEAAVNPPGPLPTVIVGDCVEQMRLMPAESVDAVVTDPPYELGFMGKRWDATGVAYSAETWAEALRVLKPGGHLVAFGGTRTYHRMVCAVEDAGFEIRDTLAWMYGVGFPKSLNLHGVWEGWGTALKPAHEPIVLARKPLQGTVAGNVGRFGVGALNIDACRIATDEDRGRPPRTPNNIYGGGAGTNLTASVSSPSGRWPANVLLDEQAAEQLGDASRFFYCAKASSRERNQGLDALPVESLGRANPAATRCASCGKQRVNMPGSMCECAEPVWEHHDAHAPRANQHPTVKPVALMRWLCRLVTPPEGLILDPFAGSGSTLIAAHLEGFHAVGVEQDADYCRIAEARLAWWQQQPQQTTL